tara:strand:- start:221 stop:745 length:525 start_codon:yes stop_codon:yes gene_type:complete
MEKTQVNKGDKFNKLEVVEELERHIYPNGKTRRKFLCKCDCGNKTIVLINKLKTTTKSCGCYRKEITSLLGKNMDKLKEKNPNYKHGLRKHKLYSTWLGIKNRCNNSNSTDYKHYGGRGIKICDRWNKSFVYFLEDMGMKPYPSYSIDRIDVNGNYEPTNCRWTTQKEQVKNRR